MPLRCHPLPIVLLMLFACGKDEPNEPITSFAAHMQVDDKDEQGCVPMRTVEYDRATALLTYTDYCARERDNLPLPKSSTVLPANEADRLNDYLDRVNLTKLKPEYGDYRSLVPDASPLFLSFISATQIIQSRLDVKDAAELPAELKYFWDKGTAMSFP